jgi:hypothetical protein
MRYLFYLLAAVCFLSGCRSSHPTLTFGEGEAILKPVLDAVLSGYKTEHAEISWGGGGGGGVFAVRDSLVVKDTDIATIAAKLSTELDKLPADRGWKSHGPGTRSGNSLLAISYEEDGARFFFDFVLTQRESDVEILVLHKGVK